MFHLTTSYRASNFSNASETMVAGAYTQPTESRGERKNKSNKQKSRAVYTALQIFALKLNIKYLHEDTFALI